MTAKPAPASGDPVDILLVEDNPGDVRLVREAFDAVDSETAIHAVTDGDDAVEYLRRRCADEEATLPDIALLDLNLPGRDGCDVLEAIRDDPDLQCLPILVLTSSAASDDVVRCNESRANAYLTKPSEYDEFTSLAGAVERFWFSQARLPPVPQ